MRVIIFLFLLFWAVKPALAQSQEDKTVKTVKTEMPSKADMQSQIKEATNEIRKQIADLEKQIASSTDAEEIKGLKDEIVGLKKQLAMIEGVNKSVSGMSPKV